MIERRIREKIEQALQDQAAVAIIGPRQVGKTTLALELASGVDALYLDLEDRADRGKLDDPKLFLERYEDSLVILDEIHRVPDLFPDLRGIIDSGRRKGKGVGRFLILGSASIDLLRQSGETLAGRIAYVNMGPLDILEVPEALEDTQRLWVRGGYPNHYLASSEAQSLRLRKDFIRTYLERDVQMFGPRLPTETLQRLWTMLAHSQGALLNISRLAGSLGIDGRTVARYVDLLADLLLVRRLPPLHANVGKRLVKSPKTYVRDSGILHALLDIPDFAALQGHPIVGASWEGFVIENLLAAVPEQTHASFYRTSAGAEMDLVLDLPNGLRWAVEAKYGLNPSLEKGTHNAVEDLRPDQTFVVYSGEDRYPKTKNIEVIGLRELAKMLSVQG